MHQPVVVGDGVIPDLLHRRVLFGENGPLVSQRLVPAPAGRGGDPNIVVLDRHGVNDVVDQAAVELMEMVETTTAESSQAAAQHADPDLARLRVDIDA